jgi:hypothetical protein
MSELEEHQREENEEIEENDAKPKPRALRGNMAALKANLAGSSDSDSDDDSMPSSNFI